MDGTIVCEKFMEMMNTSDEGTCLQSLGMIPPEYYGYVNKEFDTFLTIACKRRFSNVAMKLLAHPNSYSYQSIGGNEKTSTALGYANEQLMFDVCEKLLQNPQYCLQNVQDIVFTLESAIEHNVQSLALTILNDPYNIVVHVIQSGSYYSVPPENKPIEYPQLYENNIFFRAEEKGMKSVVKRLLETTSNETKQYLLSQINPEMSLLCDMVYIALDNPQISIGSKLSKEETYKLVAAQVQKILEKFITEASSMDTNTAPTASEDVSRRKKLKRKIYDEDDEEDTAIPETTSSHYSYNSEYGAYVYNPNTNYTPYNIPMNNIGTNLYSAPTQMPVLVESNKKVRIEE